MLSQLIWWSSIALEAFVLTRGLRGKLAFRYPVFYAYISFVLLQSLLRFSVREYQRQLYRDVFWTTEVLGVMAGCAVVFEIYRMALLQYPGTARMARSVLTLVFALALAKALAGVGGDSRSWLEASFFEIERSLRAVQAVAIVALLALFVFYAIPFGRNLRGILLGYSLFIVVRVISLKLGSPTQSDFWYYAYSAAYPLVLSLWLAHLWSYQPTPQPHTNIRLEQDYQTVAAATRRRLQGARGYLAKAVRP